jgi:murein L,D-transpeptidase YcbB/YkuD
MNFDDIKSKVSTSLDLEILKFSEDQKTKQKQENNFFKSSFAPLILSAIFAIIGAIAGAWFQGISNAKLEKQKFQASLILKMIETNGNQQKAASNLKFLIKTGLIDDKELSENIEKMLGNAKGIPSLGIVDARLKTQDIDAVMHIQEKLNILNYYKGEINGFETIELANAIKKFQKDNGLAPDGKVSFRTIQIIDLVHKRKTTTNNH